jgi:hypothetical protein
MAFFNGTVNKSAGHLSSLFTQLPSRSKKYPGFWRSSWFYRRILNDKPKAPWTERRSSNLIILIPLFVMTKTRIELAQDLLRLANQANEDLKTATNEFAESIKDLERIKAAIEVLKSSSEVALGQALGLKNDTERKAFQSQWLQDNNWGMLRQEVSGATARVETLKGLASYRRRQYELYVLQARSYIEISTETEPGTSRTTSGQILE